MIAFMETPQIPHWQENCAIVTLSKMRTNLCLRGDTLMFEYPSATHWLTLPSSLPHCSIVFASCSYCFLYLYIDVEIICSIFVYFILTFWLTGRRILLHFEAVDSAFFVWVNGVLIGYRYVLIDLVIDFPVLLLLWFILFLWCWCPSWFTYEFIMSTCRFLVII